MKQTKGILRDWDYFKDFIEGNLVDGERIKIGSVLYFSENGRYVHTSDSIYELDPPLSYFKATEHVNRNLSGLFVRPDDIADVTVLTWKTEEEEFNK